MRIGKYIFLFCIIIYQLQANANGDYRFEQIDFPNKSGLVTKCILESSNGLMWFGTNRGLVNYDGYKVRYVSSNTENGKSKDFGAIQALIEDHLNQIWLATSSGLCIYDPVRQVTKYPVDNTLQDAYCRTLYVTSKGEILVGTQKGMYVFNTDGKLQESYHYNLEQSLSLTDNIVRSVYEDSQNHIWIGTFNGLNRLDRENNKISHYYLHHSYSGRNNLILSISPQNDVSDSILLVGTETGFCLFDTNSSEFKLYKHDESVNSVSNDVIKSICTKDSLVWIGTDFGLNLFDVNDDSFKNFYRNYLNTSSISNNVIHDVHIDKNDNLWLATDYGINRAYLKSSVIRYNHFNKSSVRLDNEYWVNNITEQENGDIWVSSNEGLIKYDPEEDLFTKFLPPTILHNKVKDACIDKNGVAWLATNGGVNTINTHTNKVSSFSASIESDRGLKNNYLHCIRSATDGTVWIGSQEHGVYKIRYDREWPGRFFNYKCEVKNENSLSSNVVTDLVIDKSENVWVANDYGVNKINERTGVVERYQMPKGRTPVNQLLISKDNKLWVASSHGIYFTEIDKVNFKYIDFVEGDIQSLAVSDSVIYYIANNAFYYTNLNRKKVFRMPNADLGLKSVTGLKIISNNRLVVYGQRGFVTLKLNEFKVDESIPSVYWSGFSILNKEIKPYLKYNNRHIITQNIDNTDLIELKYKENTFKVEFSSYDYTYNKEKRFQYLLKGYDDDWKYTNEGQAYVSYTQVSPGTYKLMVNASNEYGNFPGKPREISIKIAPPFFLSVYAFSIYIFAFIFFLVVARALIIAREKTKSDVRLQKLQRMKSEELMEVKTRFFTNISHELKTPLTLISSPVDDLLSNNPDESIKPTLVLVKRNTDRLKNLVNQILDIRKIETNREKLIINENDMVSFCERVVNLFKEEAERRRIRLQYNTIETTIMMWFDIEKLEKVLVNLISNAFKFTPDKGNIQIELKDGRKLLHKTNEIIVAVRDTGSGIEKNAQVEIFDRFSTKASPNNNQHGTGIGLSLVKDYVNMHGGDVKVESELNRGSCFTFSIPLDRNKFLDHVEQEQFSGSGREKPEVVSDKTDFVFTEAPDGDQLLAMVVEDDHDMREYIVSGLIHQYKIITAENGHEGLKLAQDKVPDIIISDWLMPLMSGLELCDKLKMNLRTSHIPFILLTAKGGQESKMEGIESGADDYIQKPFSMDYLRVRMKNLIEQRERLISAYQKELKLEPSDVAVTSLDEKFLSDLVALIEENMDNSELNIKIICERMGFSHNTLSRKVKALTGQTTTEFVRSFRLKRAAQLLKTGELNVSEVMHMVGFSNRSYFTRSFKAQYGVSPKEFK